MVPQKSRLPFEEFHASGYREAVTPYFLVKVRQSVSLKNRLGIIISASSVKGAARRNFWRRQIKAVFLAIPQKKSDFLVILRPRGALPQKNVFRKALSKAIASLTQKT